MPNLTHEQLLESYQFNSSKGLMKGVVVRDAFQRASDDAVGLAYRIRHCGNYADHVTEEQKDAILKESIRRAVQIQVGAIDSFTIWQRVNEILTGESVAFLRNVNDSSTPITKD
jgi:hypothetical protein